MDQIQVVDVTEENIENLIFVCSHRFLSDPRYATGIELKKKWVRKTLREVGVCAKVAYLDGKPVGQIMFWPETSSPADPNPREGVLYLQCVFVPFPEAQRRGIATTLLDSLLEDCRESPGKLGMRECRFVVTHAFEVGGYYSQAEFFRRRGFKRCPDGGPNDLYCPIAGEYEPKPKPTYTPLEEDLGRAVVIFGTACQFGHVFAARAVELIKEVAPKLPILLINEDEFPEESKKRANKWLVVNGRPIDVCVGDAEAFKAAVREALERPPLEI